MNEVTQYLNACEELAWLFYHKYYAPEEAKGICFYWINGPGSLFAINDQFFNTQEILRAIELNVTREQLFSWYYDNWNACCENSKLSLDEYNNGKRLKTKRHQAFSSDLVF